MASTMNYQVPLESRSSRGTNYGGEWKSFTFKTATQSDTQSQDASSLRFVGVTKASIQGARDEEQRKAIRTHVMNHHVRHKNQSPEDEASPIHSRGSMAGYKSRFRLPGTSKRSVRPQHSTSKGSEEAAEDQPIGTRNTGSRASRIRRNHAPDGAQLQVCWPTGFTRRELSAQFPVEVTDNTMLLLDFYRFLLPDHRLTFSPEVSAFDFAATSSAMFHGTLAFVSLRRAFALKTAPTQCFYYHRGEAIRAIISKIGDGKCEEKVADETIGAVAILMSGDHHTCLDEGDQMSHLRGLARLVELRGGLNGLGGADLNNAAVIDRPPLIYHPAPLNSIEQQQTLHPTHLFSQPAPTVPNSSPPLPPLPSHLHRIFTTLRTLCTSYSTLHNHLHRTATSTTTATRPCQRAPSLNNRPHCQSTCSTFGDSLAHLEHDILLLPGHHPHHIPPSNTPIATANNPSTSNPPSTTTDPAAITDWQTPLRYALLLFTYLSLRRLPVEADYFRRLANRLILTLSPLLLLTSSSPPFLRQGGEGKGKELTLWMLVNGWMACRTEKRRGDRMWFCGWIREIVVGGRRNGDSNNMRREEIERGLCRIVWPDDREFRGGGILDELCEEMERDGGRNGGANGSQ
ncbi:MAG: hypothetical protein Q9227_007921 [Pyrenula ochraceoflavens]